MTLFRFRKCKDCGVEKPSDTGFYHKQHNLCRDCHKAAVRTRARTNPRVQEYDRARAKLPHRKKMARQITIKWREKNPQAYRAQTAVGNALRDGKLKRGPCSICGTTKSVHGHHKDYSKPLDVVWLCAKCHQRIHATFPELGGHYEASA